MVGKISLVQLAIHLVKLNLLRRISPVDQDFVSAIAHLQGKAVVPEAVFVFVRTEQQSTVFCCIGQRQVPIANWHIDIYSISPWAEDVS